MIFESPLGCQQFLNLRQDPSLVDDLVTGGLEGSIARVISSDRDPA